MISKVATEVQGRLTNVQKFRKGGNGPTNEKRHPNGVPFGFLAGAGRHAAGASVPGIRTLIFRPLLLK